MHLQMSPKSNHEGHDRIRVDLRDLRLVINLPEILILAFCYPFDVLRVIFGEMQVLFLLHVFSALRLISAIKRVSFIIRILTFTHY